MHTYMLLTLLLYQAFLQQTGVEIPSHLSSLRLCTLQIVRLLDFSVSGLSEKVEGLGFGAVPKLKPLPAGSVQSTIVGVGARCAGACHLSP